MKDLLKKTFVYRLYLQLRIKFFTNEKLLIQLTKRSHSLDKTILSGNINPMFNFEVRELLKEISKREWERESNVSEISKWSWDLLYQSEFRDIKKEEKEDNIKESVASSSDDIEKIVKERRSVRVWKDIKLERKEIEKLLDTAKWAPNSCNRQLWKVLIIEKEEEKKYLELICYQPFIFKAPMVLVSFIKIEEYGKEEENYGYLDTGAFLQNFLLLAHSKGLGCCWVGIKHSEEYTKNFDEFCKSFNIPRGYIPTSIIPLGYPEKTPYAPPRKSISEILIS